MTEQVARVLGPAVTIEIGRSGGGGEALDTRSDRHRDHVLFQTFVVADAGIAAGRQNVDESALSSKIGCARISIAASSNLFSNPGGNASRGRSFTTLVAVSCPRRCGRSSTSSKFRLNDSFRAQRNRDASWTAVGRPSGFRRKNADSTLQ